LIFIASYPNTCRYVDDRSFPNLPLFLEDAHALQAKKRAAQLGRSSPFKDASGARAEIGGRRMGRNLDFCARATPPEALCVLSGVLKAMPERKKGVLTTLADWLFGFWRPFVKTLLRAPVFSLSRKAKRRDESHRGHHHFPPAAQSCNFPKPRPISTRRRRFDSAAPGFRETKSTKQLGKKKKHSLHSLRLRNRLAYQRFCPLSGTWSSTPLDVAVVAGRWCTKSERANSPLDERPKSPKAKRKEVRQTEKGRKNAD